MKDELKKVLNRFVVELTAQIDPDHGLFRLLLAHEILPEEEIETCRVQPTRSERVDKILTLLKLQPDECYDKFCLALENIRRKDVVDIYLKPIPTAASQEVPPPSRTVNENQSQMESPDVFISYQWDNQEQIKALYDCLTSEGRTCWLDIKQIEGGDVLYAEIYRGIQGCKVFLSCVTAKYAESENCRKEVIVADSLKKKIVPLLLEKESWPPEGPMGMILTPLRYINFTLPNENAENTRQQFDELFNKL